MAPGVWRATDKMRVERDTPKKNRADLGPRTCPKIAVSASCQYFELLREMGNMLRPISYKWA